MRKLDIGWLMIPPYLLFWSGLEHLVESEELFEGFVVLV